MTHALHIIHPQQQSKLLALLTFALLIATGTLHARGYYPAHQRPDHIMIYALPAAAHLQYKSTDAASKMSPVINAGVEYAHFIHHSIGFSIGVEYNTFASKYSFDHRRDSLQMFDTWSGYHYQLKQQLYTTEQQKVSYLSFPLKFHIRQSLTPSINLNLSGGVVFNAYLSQKQTILARTIHRQAYFDDIHVNIDDFQPLLFGTFNQFIQPSPDLQLGVSRTYTAQIGLSFQLNDYWALHTEINYQKGTKDLKQRNINLLMPNEYAGVTATNYIGTVKPQSLGLKIGLAYTFDLFNVDCKCQNSWWKSN